jgi:predicted DNA-binding transcriptional regulator AlpA
MTTNSDIVKKQLIDALEKSLGIVTTACKIVGCARSTFYEYYSKDQDFKNQVDELQNMTLDFAESQLHQQIKKGNTTATIFYLKTKGKHRGYIERKEVEMTASVSTSKLSEEAKKKIEDILENEY